MQERPAIIAVTTVITLAAVGLAIAGSLPASVDGFTQRLEKVRQKERAFGGAATKALSVLGAGNS
jgi:hypothetical protein